MPPYVSPVMFTTSFPEILFTKSAHQLSVALASLIGRTVYLLFQEFPEIKQQPCTQFHAVHKISLMYSWSFFPNFQVFFTFLSSTASWHLVKQVEPPVFLFGILVAPVWRL